MAGIEGIAVFHGTSLGCGCCGNGLVAFVLAGDGRRVVLFCLNCGSWYASASHNADTELLDFVTPEGPELVLPDSGCSVLFPPARWATVDEIRGAGWGDYLDQRFKPPDWSPEEQPWWPRRVRGVI